MKESYDKNYFENGLKIRKSGYDNYRWLPERTHREIGALICFLGIEPRCSVLDFGCAKGYWVKALRHYNIDAYGVDTSNYALKNSDREIRRFLHKKMTLPRYDLIVSRNTLEHLTEEELRETLKKFYTKTDAVFFSVPLCAKSGGKYIVPIADLDITHKIRWPYQKWIKICKECGWRDVKPVFEIKGIHDGWGKYKKGIGFFVLTK